VNRYGALRTTTPNETPVSCRSLNLHGYTITRRVYSYPRQLSVDKTRCQPQTPCQLKKEYQLTHNLHDVTRPHPPNGQRISYPSVNARCTRPIDTRSARSSRPITSLKYSIPSSRINIALGPFNAEKECGPTDYRGVLAAEVESKDSHMHPCPVLLDSLDSTIWRGERVCRLRSFSCRGGGTILCRTVACR
jgi:hypothetical protein